jgi:CRP/FNR family transcriptional regulator
MATVRAPYNLGPAENCHVCSKRGGAFFCDLTTTALDQLNRVSYVNTYPPGAVLFVERQVPRGVYILCKGQAKLSVVAEDGRTLIIKIAGPGELLGACACLSGRSYEATVETLTPCEVNFIKTEDFHKLLRSNSDICMQAARQMSRQYQNACRELRWVGLSRSADWRVASLLLVWAEERGTPGPVPGFKMTLTHEGLAQMVGTTRETITRVIARFRRQGFIAVRGATILLSNIAALRDIAGRTGAAAPERSAPRMVTKAAPPRPIFV